MSGFRDHFLDKYFAYRRRYVDYIVREAPRRGSLAVVSEIARLGFMMLGCALCAAIFWIVFASAIARAHGFGIWPVVFGACALVPTWFAVMTGGGILDAARDRARVRDLTRG